MKRTKKAFLFSSNSRGCVDMLIGGGKFAMWHGLPRHVFAGRSPLTVLASYLI